MFWRNTSFLQKHWQVFEQSKLRDCQCKESTHSACCPSQHTIHPKHLSHPATGQRPTYKSRIFHLFIYFQVTYITCKLKILRVSIEEEAKIYFLLNQTYILNIIACRRAVLTNHKYWVSQKKCPLVIREPFSLTDIFFDSPCTVCKKRRVNTLQKHLKIISQKRVKKI